MSYLSEDSIVILLLCSDLALDRNNKSNPKPYTTLQWQKLSEKIINSSVKRPSELLKISKEDLERTLHLNYDEVEQIDALMSRKVNLAIEIDNLSSKGLNITTRAEKNYPARLKKVLKKKCPPVLYYAGDINLCNLNAMAVVGSRNVDDEGAEFARLLSEKCVASGLVIVSGGATGVDSIAETGAINRGGKAISIISDSLVKKVMINANRKAIMDGKLLMISAVNPKASFKGFNAMDRNKYIYAMSDFSTVIASDFNKGGTWNGAIENIKNTWVPLLVRSGNEIPIGNKELINKGAIKITHEQLDASFNLIEWLINNKKPSNGEVVEQLSMYNAIKENKAESTIDLYELIKNDIINFFVCENTVNAAATAFNILEAQMLIWIEKAVAQKLLNRVDDTDNYIKIDGGH
jgi:predicted Rossmann fold nucleotide-binding protein DprA/Smf involved in DNA uptake